VREGASELWLIGQGLASIALDLDDNRLELATQFGATDAVNDGQEGWHEKVMG